MIDRFSVPLLTPWEAAQHLDIPERTIREWLKREVAGHPLVHSVPPVRYGHPSVPFIALVEAYVLRSLRNLRMSPKKIAAAVQDIRREFNNEYGLASKKIATDGIDVFVHYLESDELARVGDQQTPIRRVVDTYLRYLDFTFVRWVEDDEYPVRLTLRKYDPRVAEVVIDPRFGWGAPIVEPSKARVDDVLGMWRAGESSHVVAEEYGLSVEQVEALVRVAA